MTAFPIRLGTPVDAAALAHFAARTFEETFAAANDPAHLAQHISTAYGVEQQLLELSDPVCRTLLVDAAGELVAYAQVRHHPPPPCVTGPAPVELARFYVDRPWHGRGIAARLMASVAETATALGGKTLWLGVWEQNPRAIAFYAKSGFSDAGSTDFFVGPDRQTDRVMVADVGRLGGTRSA